MLAFDTVLTSEQQNLIDKAVQQAEQALHSELFDVINTMIKAGASLELTTPQAGNELKTYSALDTVRTLIQGTDQVLQQYRKLEELLSSYTTTGKNCSDDGCKFS
jgi:hypothetical protein